MNKIAVFTLSFVMGATILNGSISVANPVYSFLNCGTQTDAIGIEFVDGKLITGSVALNSKLIDQVSVVTGDSKMFTFNGSAYKLILKLDRDIMGDEKNMSAATLTGVVNNEAVVLRFNNCNFHTSDPIEGGG